MEVNNRQLEKNVSASFGYVKKDMLMLNDAFSDLHDKIQHLSLNNATLLEQVTKLRREVAALKTKKAAPKAKAKPKVAKKAVAKKTVKKAAKKVKKVKTVKPKTAKKREDLTRIEGIGPAIKKFLWKKNIDTYRKLGNKTPEELRELLDKAGPEYQMHNPSTWPRQARMAAKGEYKELKELQERLKGGLYEKKAAKKKTTKKKTAKKATTKKKAAKPKIKKVVTQTTTYQ